MSAHGSEGSSNSRIGGMSAKGEFVIVFVRDLLCIDTIDGLLESGGEGRQDRGVSKDVLEPTNAVVGAIAGDWRGDWIGSSILPNSEMRGGRRGVVA